MSKPEVLEFGELVPSDETAEQVAVMAACGLSLIEIAKVLKCEPLALKRLYQSEFENGSAMATAKVGGALYARAVLGDTKAAMFWLECRAGWKRQPATPKEAPAEEAKGDVVRRILSALSVDQRQAVLDSALPPAGAAN